MPAEIDLQRCLPAQFHECVTAACEVIQQHRILAPWVGCVLGSGLGGLAAQVTHATSIPYADVPGFSKTHAVGHAGRLVLGYFGGVPVVLLQGRSHRYEGRSPREVQFPIYVLRALGATTLITTNAAGGVNPTFRVGDLMVINRHIDLLWPGQFGRAAPLGEPIPSPAKPELQLPCVVGYDFPRPVSPYCLQLTAQVNSIAQQHGIAMQQGCYVGTLGPTYETRAEYKFFRWAGADAVGMSTIPEVIAAAQLGMKVLGISVITNVASTDTPQETSHAEVVQSSNQAGPKLQVIVRELLEQMSGQPD
ncbi:MAG: purine-nucleoside phosphorylase [Pirellulaceae bacterium]|nr:purine-nucleoside phosphorylase [Pirellulaceae bacterium]